MKVINVFANIFSIFAFLTLGSLLIIVASHILPVEEAVFKIREIYSNPWRSIQTGFMGVLFIGVGLIFTRLLLKKGRDTEALIYQSENGPIFVSSSAIEDACKKVLKHFHLIKDSKIKSMINGKNIEVRARLTLWSGGKVQQLLIEIQEEMKNRVQKLVGNDFKVEVLCDVMKVEDHENQWNPQEEVHA